ncbi:MAG: hypothetical protein ACREEC_04700 [Thermoplasmata archaeon]
MGSTDEGSDPIGEQIEQLRAVVPARAVLTELARGFLLVHESNPDRAIRFAETFLRERAEAVAPDRVDASRPVTRARLLFGRLPRGAVDPSNFPPVR